VGLVDRYVVRDWGPLAVAAPFLAFPLTFPLLTVAALAVAAVLLYAAWRYDRSENRRVHALLTWPAIVLLACAAGGAMISSAPHRAVPKFCGIVLGVLLLRAVLTTATTPRRIRVLAALYVAAGVAIVAAALFVSPQWQKKYQTLYQAGYAIPRVVQGLPGAEEGVNTNALGATTLFFLPLAALWVMAGSDRWLRVGAAAAACGMASVLVLSQSRTAWAGAVVAAGLMAAMRSRAVAVLCAVAAAAALTAVAVVGPSDLLGRMQVRSQEVYPYPVREDRTPIWSAAGREIAAHPLTGIGLGAFGQTARSRNVRDETVEVVHAHNTFLQVALDTGIVGLASYVALLVLVTLYTLRLQQQAGPLAALALGLWGGLVATHVFGLTDAIALGAKVGLFFWWSMGLIAAAHRLTAAPAVP
jgi:putative inorganic carbon (HCO3(-)) transporter